MKSINQQINFSIYFKDNSCSWSYEVVDPMGNKLLRCSMDCIDQTDTLKSIIAYLETLLPEFQYVQLLQQEKCKLQAKIDSLLGDVPREI